KLFVDYGGLDQFESRILDPRLKSASKAALSQYTAEELIKNRVAAINKISSMLDEEMKGFPVKLDSIQVDNIQLPQKYLQSIETKQTEKNLAAAEKHKLERQALEAQREVNTAKANSESITLRARAEADSIKMKGLAEAEASCVRGARAP
ncbi:SPFH domain-containing protein, partial [uncultured Lentibacter sp.]|uniref:SPFH domain-containing protein n=1 Tax=uncultured Lentibacter sp. TaxID=1659309 RepID=UPI002622B276